MTEEEVQQWESTYRALMAELDGYTEDIEQRLNTVSSMADRLGDWRVDESYGVTSENWQKLKKAALAKIKELDRVWARRHGSGGETNSGSKVQETQPFASRPSVMQPTASSSSRVKAVLGSPGDPTPTHRKRPSTSSAITRGTKTNPASPVPSLPGNPIRYGNGRARSGTVAAQSAPRNVSQTDLSFKKRAGMSSTPSFASLAMTSAFSPDTKRKAPVIRKNGSTASIASMSHVLESFTPASKPQPSRTPYKPDVNNALDVEVARVVNASGFPMRVQKLNAGQSPYLTTGHRTRDRSDSTSSLAPGGLTENGVHDSTKSITQDTGSLKPLSKWNSQAGGADGTNNEIGRYVIGDLEPKVCHCRILKNNQVMVRVGGGWCELSK